MTQYFARGVGGSWSVAGTWSNSSGGASNGLVPTAAIDCVLDASSGAVTIDGTSGSPNLCRSLDCTGFTGTLTHGASKQLNVGDGTTGAFKLVSGMTYGPSSTATVKFVSTTTGNNITWGTKNPPGTVTFDGVGGGWQFQDAPGTGNAGTITLTNGAVDFNSKNVTSYLSSNNSNTRTLTFGTLTWTIPDNGLAGGWDLGTTTGLTCNPANVTIVDASTTTNQTFAGGGLSYLSFSCTTLTTATITISGNNTFGTLTLSMGATTKGATSGYSISGTQTVSGTFTANGNSTILRNFIYGTTIGTAATISAATVSVTHTDFRDITGAGAGSWNFSGLTTTANGNAGGNSGITFTAPKNCYMKTAVSVNWSGSNWFTASGGSSAIVPAMPLVHDSVFFDANSVTAGSKTITLDEPRVPGMDWTNIANSPTFATGSTAWESYGSLILVSALTHSGSGTATFMGRGSFTLDGGSTTWPTSSIITLNAPGGTLSIARNFVSNAPITVTNGTFAENGFTANLTAITINGGAWSGSGAITGTTCTVSGGTFTLGGTLTLTGALAVSSGTLNMNGNQITGHTTTTISSTGTLNLSGQLNGSGLISVTGGTITDAGASGELKGTTCSFSGGTSAIRKMTLTSTFAISSTAALTLNPGTYTYVTSWTETGTTKTFAINGTLTETGGVKTVTAASGGSSSFSS